MALKPFTSLYFRLSLEPMLYAFGKGLLSGAIMSLMLGTVFFSLIQNSIQSGWRKGVLIALGVVSSDLIFISLAVVGVSYMDPENGNRWIPLSAAALLCFLGINMLLNRRPRIAYPETRLGKLLFYFSNGFLLNMLNPMNFIAWAGLATIARTEWSYNTQTLLIFFAACLISIFVMEVLISYGAHRIKHFMNEEVLLWINRITGLIFIGIAVKLIFELYI